MIDIEKNVETALYKSAYQGLKIYFEPLKGKPFHITSLDIVEGSFQIKNSNTKSGVAVLTTPEIFPYVLLLRFFRFLALGLGNTIFRFQCRHVFFVLFVQCYKLLFSIIYPSLLVYNSLLLFFSCNCCRLCNGLRLVFPNL